MKSIKLNFIGNMVPIAQTSVENFDEEGFKTYLLNLCNQHRQENRALAFAFIVYDFDDHTIPEILENKKYWSALDKISGHFLSIFYINSQDSYYSRRQKEIYEEELKQQRRSSQNGHMQLMRPITLQATPLEKSVRFLKTEFQLEESIQHPFVLFFQTDGENILDYFVVELKQEKLEDSFLELKSQIKNAVDSLSKLPDNYQNNQRVFDLIEAGVQSGRFRNFIRTKVVPNIGLGKIFSLLKIMAGA